jgi:cell division protein FtsW (lipid II flippase)
MPDSRRVNLRAITPHRAILAAVAAAPVVTLLVIGFSMWPGGRLARNEPHLQVIGHYVDTSRRRALSLGSSGRADIVLTEPDIDQIHGWLIPDGARAWRYIHASPSAYASGRGVRSDAQTIDGGDRVIVQSPGGAAPACSSPAVTLSVKNATSVLARSGNADPGIVVLADGEFFPLPTGGAPVYLTACNGRVGITNAAACTSVFRPIEGLAPNIAATFGHPSSIASQAEKLMGQTDPRLAVLRQLRFGIPLFAHRQAAFIATGPRTEAPVQSMAPQLEPSGAPYWIVSTSPSFPLSLDGRWFRHYGERTLLVRRGADPAASIWVCSGTSGSGTLIGEIRGIENGSEWILGATQYRLVQTDPRTLALVSVERSDRRHYFLSLSSGRLDAFAERQAVPRCGAGRIQFLGRAESDAPAASATDDSTGSVVMPVRLPSWVAAAHPAIAQGHTSEIDMGSACSGDEGLIITPPASPVPNAPAAVTQPVDASGNALRGSIAPGGRFQLGGHLFEYRGGSPRYEQLAILFGFAIFLGVAGCAAVQVLDRGLGDALDQSPQAIFGRGGFVRLAAVIIGAMTSLMMCGALLMMRMAVSDRLIGKPDYVHRQIFMSAMASILFVAILAASVAVPPPRDDHRDDVRDDDEAPLADQLLASARAAAELLAAGGSLLLLWIVVDAVGWLIAARDWVAASGLSIMILLRSWVHSFAWPHFAPFLGALVVLLLIKPFPDQLRRFLAGKCSLRQAWRLPMPRMAVIGAAAVALLLCCVAYVVLCPIPWMAIPAWICLGAAITPLIEPFVYRGERPRRPGRTRMAVLAALLLLAAGRIPRDSLDIAELIAFLLLSAAVAVGLALVILVTTYSLRRNRLPRRVVDVLGLGQQVPGDDLYVDHHVQLLTAGFVFLALGLFLRSGQSLFGVKPAEFAVWFLASGIAMFLAKRWSLVQTSTPERPISRIEFRLRVVPLLFVFAATAVLFFIPRWRLLTVSMAAVGLPIAIYALPRAGWRDKKVGQWLTRQRLPITTMFLMLSIESAVLILYAAQGDFGPLLVLVPAVLLTMSYWALAPERSTKSTTRQRVSHRIAIVASLFAASIGLAAAGYVVVKSKAVQNLPFIGKSINRAADRLQTYTDSWYTSSGSWSVTANWIAAGYTDERYLSNLHSDLAAVALRQSFGIWRTIAVACGYILLVALFGILAGNFQHSYATVLGDARDPAAVSLRKSILVASLVLWFTAFYLLLAAIIHVLTNFNFVPQTGLALPWVSSGGSAAIAFSGLMAIALGMAARVYVRLEAREHAGQNG